MIRKRPHVGMTSLVIAQTEAMGKLLAIISLTGYLHILIVFLFFLTRLKFRKICLWIILKSLRK